MTEESSPLATRYDALPVEEKWYRHWEERGYFHADARVFRGHKPIYA